MKFPSINLKWWMGHGELAKLARAFTNYWQIVQRALEFPLQKHDAKTAPIAIVDLLAWQRDVQRLEKEPEFIYRARVANAYSFARNGGETLGFKNMFAALGIDWCVIHERNDPVDWDVVTVETKSNDIANNGYLMDALIRKYGRTCRRYQFNVSFPENLTIKHGQFAHSQQIYYSTLEISHEK